MDPAPTDSDGVQPGRLRRLDVERRIADVHGLAGSSAQPFEREEQRLGIGLVLLRLVAADDRLEQVLDRDSRKRELHGLPALGRDDSEPAAFVLQLHEDLVHPGATGELVVQRLIVRPVNRDELVRTVGRKGLHLRLEPRPADRGHQLLVGNLHAENLPGGVSHRSENDRARIDDGAVEIEENDRKTHDVMLAACTQYSTRSR